MRDIMGLTWRAWWMVALVFGIFVSAAFGGTMRGVGVYLEQFQVLALTLVALLLVIPLLVIYVMRRRGRLRLALTLTLFSELLFFFMIPVIPMVHSGTRECSLNDGFCFDHVTYGSISYVYGICTGTSLQVRTDLTTPPVLFGNRTTTLAHFNGTVPSWVPPPVSGYSWGCVFA